MACYWRVSLWSYRRHICNQCIALRNKLAPWCCIIKDHSSLYSWTSTNSHLPTKATPLKWLHFCPSWWLIHSGLPLRAVTCNTCYCCICLIFPWCYGLNCLLLMEFIHIVTSLLQVWRARVQVTQNLMTALIFTLQQPPPHNGNND